MEWDEKERKEGRGRGSDGSMEEKRGKRGGRGESHQFRNQSTLWALLLDANIYRK